MTTFDKMCACLAIPIGAVFLVLGAVGLFAGCSAHFTLPPGMGVRNEVVAVMGEAAQPVPQ